MESYNVITGETHDATYYRQAKRIEDLENYIMEESYDPWRNLWCGYKELKGLGITDEQMRMFEIQKQEELENAPF